MKLDELRTRVPPVATIIVVLAVLAMVGLGVWQLQRARWKDGLLADYRAAAGKPPVMLPRLVDEASAPLFRRTSAICLSVTGWQAVAGRNIKGQPGWSHIARCRTGIDGPGLSVDIGWSNDPKPPVWRGGEVEGIVAPDTRHVIRLIASRSAPGLQPSAPPDVETIPNNHLAYAVQWFAFAAAAAVIYALALRRRR